jgi:hypothetical protein
MDNLVLSALSAGQQASIRGGFAAGSSVERISEVTGIPEEQVDAYLAWWRRGEWRDGGA